MITKQMIAKGLTYKAIKLVLISNEGGVVAQIGENWFYFGGWTAEESKSVEEYMLYVPFDDIVNEIYETLVDFYKHENLRDEALYYEYYLKEVIDDSETARKNTFMTYIENRFNVSGEFMRLLSNVIDFAFTQGSYEEQETILLSLLTGTIGLTEDEIKTLLPATE